MEILDEGFRKREYTKVCKCGYCGCKFEADEKYFYGVINIDRFQTNYWIGINCPDCNHKVEYRKNLFPSVVYDRIFKKKTIIDIIDCSINHSTSEICEEGCHHFIKCGEKKHIINDFIILQCITLDNQEEVILTHFMDIIKPGFKDQKYIKICICTHCGIKFRANEDLFCMNIVFDGKKQKKNTLFYKYKILCPDCKFLIEFLFDKFPTVSYIRLLKKNLTKIRFVGCTKNHTMTDIHFRNSQYEIDCEDEKHVIHESELGPNIIKVIKSNQKEKFE